MPYSDPYAQRRYQREWKARRREEWFRANGPCRCGSWDRLQADHIDRKTKVTHAVWSWSKQRRDAELAKCQPLCYDCHWRKSRAEIAANSRLKGHHGAHALNRSMTPEQRTASARHAAKARWNRASVGQ